jgi:hypothetical protein
MSANRIRWYGLPAILAGVLYVVGLPGSNEVFPGISHVAGHILLAGAGLCSLLGLEGVCRRDDGRLGRVGRLGINLGQFAAFVLFAANTVEAIWEHRFVDLTGAGSMLGLLGLIAGLVLLGIGARRTRALPDWSALTLIIASVIFFGTFVGGMAVLASGDNPPTTAVGNAPLTALLYVLAVVLAIPWMAIGYALWSGTREGGL